VNTLLRQRTAPDAGTSWESMLRSIESQSIKFCENAQRIRGKFAEKRAHAANLVFNRVC
jgi:hypothetical protein